MVLLTVVSDIDEITRSENGGRVGIVKAGGVFGAVLDLGTGTEHQCASSSSGQMRDLPRHL